VEERVGPVQKALCGVGACACIVPTLGDPRDTSLARIDRIPQARPP
jgi:hypothetical protein